MFGQEAVDLCCTIFVLDTCVQKTKTKVTTIEQKKKNLLFVFWL